MSSDDKHSILRSSAVVSGYTALSRVLGFVREILMAFFFGTTLAKSAFDVAFRIPNLFRRLFGEGALSAAFIPVFSDALEHEGMAGANRLSGRVLSMLTLALAAIVVVVVAAVTVTVSIGVPDPRAMAVLRLLQIMFPYMLFICLVALCMAILNTFRHFWVPAFTPVILNVVWILTLIFICPRLGDDPRRQINGIAWGILAAGVVQLAAQIPALRRVGIRPQFGLDWHDKRIRKMLILMGPAALGMGILQLNVLVDSVLALFVGEWAPAALTYAERLIYLPLGVFATALGTVLMPAFSRSSARGNIEEIKQTMGFALRNIFLIMIPAAAGLVALALPIVELAFQWEHGRFDPGSAALTSRALMFYAPGLIAFGAFKALAPAFYSMKDTLTPVKIGIPVVFLNLVLNITFIATWPVGYRHAGLAMATAVASAVNCLCLGYIFHRKAGSPGWAKVFGKAMLMLFSALIMAFSVYFIHFFLREALEPLAWPEKVAQLVAVGAAIVAGVVIYGTGIRVLCPEEFRNVSRVFADRMKQK